MLRLDRESHIPLYLQIVDQIKSQVASGTLQVGDRIPATRELAREYHLHRNTVCTAYVELVADGIIQSHVGKGTFITSIFKDPKKNDTGKLSTFAPVWERILLPQEKEDLFAHLIPHGAPDSCISFASALPIADLFLLRRLNRLVNEVFRKKGQQLLEFGEPAGYRLLRERLIEKMRGWGIKSVPQEVMITNGCQQSLSIIRQVLVKPGDTVFIENPTYPGALRVFNQPDIRCIGIPVTPDGLDLDLLENMLQYQRPRLLYVTPSFHNPTGRTMHFNQRTRLLRIAVQYGVPLIEDDIYSDLRYEGNPLPCLKSIDDAGAVIYVSSFSKVGFPGLRVGWLVAPKPVTDRLIGAKEMQDLHTNVLGQAILAELIQGGLLTRHLKKIRHEYCLRRNVMVEALKNYFPKDTKWYVPEGGMSIWLTLPQTVDSTALLSLSIQNGVIFSPGARFYLTGAVPNLLRLTFTVKEIDRIEEGVRILGAIVKQMIAKAKPKAPGRSAYRAPLV